VKQSVLPRPRYVALTHSLLLAVAFCGIVMSGCSSKKSDVDDEKLLLGLSAFQPTVEKNPEGRVIDIKLEGEHVTDAAIEEVIKFSELKRLSLYGSSVTDQGLQKLSSCRKLESLGLGRTKITRKGLRHLEPLPCLSWLWLNDTKNLTPAQIEDFRKKAVPALTIYR
jgi:hypothetical protein